MRRHAVRRTGGRSLAALLVAVALVVAAMAAAVHTHGAFHDPGTAASLRAPEGTGPAHHPGACQVCRMAHNQLPALDPPAPAGALDDRVGPAGAKDAVPLLSADRSVPHDRAPPALLS